MNITIAEEINYLGSYLELEKIRFSPAFEYVIQLAPEIQADYTFIPSMLLQPFVENAIRHGIRYKKDGTGFICVGISQFQDGIEFSIEDNGIGREAAKVHKNEQHIEYQSKGITLTQNRLDILNLFMDKKITVRIDDLKDMSGNATGTKVFIFFPHNIIDKFRQQ
jgi:sensor histidine kinase YesM